MADNPQHTAPLAYFLTWTCHGTWLHGDERGSVDRRWNQAGSPILEPHEPRWRFERETRLRGEPVRLDRAMRVVVESAIRECCDIREWLLHAINVRTNHVHGVVSAPDAPELVMTAFKANATRSLREAGVVAREARVWTRHGSTRHLWSERDLAEACVYVLEGQGEPLD